MRISKIGLLLLLSANSTFTERLPVCKYILSQNADRGGQAGRLATNGPNFKVSSRWIHITWKNLHLDLNKQEHIFQVMEQSDFSECETNF